MISISTYTATELLAWTQTSEFLQMPVIPISLQRALSIANSPRTKPNDVVLACAFRNNNLVGYLGVLPDDIFVHETSYHIGWLTAMWVCPTQRGKGIAKQLINTLLATWDNMLVTTNQSPEAAIVFNRHKQFVCRQNVGQRFYIKSRVQQIVQRNNLNRFKPFLAVVDDIINLLHRARQYTSRRQNTSYQILSNITTELADFITKHPLQSICKRNHTLLQWIVAYPWVYQSTSKNTLANQYEFTITTPDYCNQFLVCKNAQQQILAIALVMIKNGELKVSYTWSNPRNQQQLSEAIYSYAKKMGVFEITLFSNSSQQIFKPSSNEVIFQKSITRHFYISTKVNSLINNVTHPFLDGDGDCCFA